VAGGGGVDSMILFQLERRDDGMKKCWKMKRRRRVCLGSMGWKRDMVWRRDNIGRRRGGTEKGKERRWRELD
jgi:hypothetical protein